MEQLFKLKEITGLTIEKSIIVYNNKLIFKFTNDKFIVFDAIDSDFCANGNVKIAVSTDDLPLTPNVYNCEYLFNLNVISELEYTQIVKEFQDKNDKLVRENELKILKQLKEKYKNDSTE